MNTRQAWEASATRSATTLAGARCERRSGPQAGTSGPGRESRAAHGARGAHGVPSGAGVRDRRPRGLGRRHAPRQARGSRPRGRQATTGMEAAAAARPERKADVSRQPTDFVMFVSTAQRARCSTPSPRCGASRHAPALAPGSCRHRSVVATAPGLHGPWYCTYQSLTHRRWKLQQRYSILIKGHTSLPWPLNVRAQPASPRLRWPLSLPLPLPFGLPLSSGAPSALRLPKPPLPSGGRVRPPSAALAKPTKGALPAC